MVMRVLQGEEASCHICRLFIRYERKRLCNIVVVKTLPVDDHHNKATELKSGSGHHSLIDLLKISSRMRSVELEKERW